MLLMEDQWNDKIILNALKGIVVKCEAWELAM